MSRSITLRGIAALLGITVMLAGSTRSAQTATPDTIRVGRAVSTAFAFATLEVGVDAHIWDKVGLKLDIATFKGDADVQRAMTAGQIDFGLGGGPAMGYHNKGVPGIAVASMYGPPTDMAIVVANNGPIKTVGDFKGKKLGVTTAGSLTDWLRSRSDQDLVTLLRARPDLTVPLPADMGTIAGRLGVRTSAHRAVDGLDAFTLRVLEALVLPVSAQWSK